MTDAKDIQPREDDRSCAEGPIGKADEAQQKTGEIDESPVPDPEKRDKTAEDDPEAD